MLYQLLQPALWAITAAVFVACLVLAVRAWRRATSPRRPLIGAAAAAVIAVLLIPAVAFVPAGHRGVVYNWNGGIELGERGEGITFLMPWVQSMRLMSIRSQKFCACSTPKHPVPGGEVAAFTQSKDLQEITALVAVNYHVIPKRAAELYRNVGPDYRRVVIRPAVYERAKEAVGDVLAEAIAANRENVATDTKRLLNFQLRDRYGIEIEYVNIEDAIFQPAFVKSVQQKVIAEQEAARQKNLIEARRAEKTQTIVTAEATARKIQIEAEAQATANRVIEQSLAPKVLRWKWLVTWDGKLPATLVGDKDVSLFLGGVGSESASSYGYGQ